MSGSRATTATVGEDDQTYNQDLPMNHEDGPENVNPEMLDDLSYGPPSDRLIIAVDFGTTYSAVSYVAIPRGAANDFIDPRSIHSIRNYPDSWNFHSNDQMHMEVPTEVLYPMNRDFREQESFDAMDQDSDNNAGDIDGDVHGSNFGTTQEHDIWPEGDGDLGILTDHPDRFHWGYEVHELWSLPATHVDGSNQPLSQFKLLLDSSNITEPVRNNLGSTIRELRRRRVITGHLHVIADFLTYLLRHTQSELRREGFGDNYNKEIVLCVPAIWSQKACRDMQACLAVAMQRANFQGVDVQNNSIENLFIVSEPEAAAAHVLTAADGLMCDDVFVLLDAGGGTVDANTYQISNSEPLRLSREVVPPGGGLYGSSFINQSFRAHLQQLLADETYLEQGTETIKGIIEKIMIDHFEYRIKRSFDMYTTKGYKQIAISGLRDNPSKGFTRGSVRIPVERIREMFRERLEGIGAIMENQITTAAQRGYKVEKVILIGGFASSVSLNTFLRNRLDRFNGQHNCNIKLKVPKENVPSVNAVASGAVQRAFNKSQGPQREARSSYGIMRTEPFNEYPEHEGLHPYYDRHDGQPYIRQTVDWVLKLGSLVPPVWQCPEFLCTHTFNAWPEGPLVCKEVLYVSDRSTQSHYRLSHPMNEGAEKVGEIIVDFSFLRDQGLITPIEPEKTESGKKVGSRHYKVNYTMVIRVVDRDLECYAIYNKEVKKRCRINIASGFSPGVK